MTELESRRSTIRLPRFLWIMLGTAVLVGVAVGICFLLPVYRQQVAIREIERLGGHVSTIDGGPDWLRRMIGREWMKPFNEVVGIAMTDRNVTDTDLVHLKGLTDLTGPVRIGRRTLMPAQLQSVRLIELRWLGLERTNITDAGLVQLKELTALEFLSLDGTLVSDAGLVDLKELTGLAGLSLEGTRVTDTGLVHLEKLTDLGWLNLRDTQVTAEGVAELQAALPGLTIEYELTD